MSSDNVLTRRSLGIFIYEEMIARGWSFNDLHAQLGNDPITCNAVDLLLAVDDKNLVLDTTTAAALGRAFDVNPELFLNLDRAYRES